MTEDQERTSDVRNSVVGVCMKNTSKVQTRTVKVQRHVHRKNNLVNMYPTPLVSLSASSTAAKVKQ